jgi:threonine-phosphate decarboxylase
VGGLGGWSGTLIRGHGGNVLELARRLGCNPADICDMSSNVNPLGPLPELMAHLHRRLDLIQALPEVDAAAMTAAFADASGLAPDEVLAGNGSTELIYLLPRILTPPRAVVVGPTYADYADACHLAGVPVAHVTADAHEAFASPLGRLKDALKPGDLVFVCNPNNPTGVLVDAEAILGLAADRPDCVFVVDESYLPFAPEGKSLAGRGPDNLLVLSSMSKIHRIAGLRIGFLIGPAPILVRLHSHRPPWSVNALAQEAVTFLSAHPVAVARFLRETRSFLQTEKRLLREQLQSCRELRIFPSRASFVLLQLPPAATAADVCRALARERILVRDCGNFVGLDPRFIRISLKDAEANRRVADGLQRAVETTGKL